jgi:hypothetical protein
VWKTLTVLHATNAKGGAGEAQILPHHDTYHMRLLCRSEPVDLFLQLSQTKHYSNEVDVDGGQMWSKGLIMYYIGPRYRCECDVAAQKSSSRRVGGIVIETNCDHWKIKVRMTT